MNLPAAIAASGLEAARTRNRLEHGTLEPVVLQRENAQARNSQEPEYRDGGATCHQAGHRDGTIRSSDEALITVEAKPRDRVIVFLFNESIPIYRERNL
jgi:hypothetical protein